MTPRCASGCGTAATHELLRSDGEPFRPPILACDSAARVHGLAHARRLRPADVGLPPRPRQRPQDGPGATNDRRVGIGATPANRP